MMERHTGMTIAGSPRRSFSGRSGAGAIGCCLALVAAVIIFPGLREAWADTGPLPSWVDGSPARKSIVSFVEAVTKPGPEYVRPEERIATFDLDGTLWTEQPEYAEKAFLMDLLKFHSDPAGRYSFLSSPGTIMQAIKFGRGMPQSEFKNDAESWLNTTKHPCFGRPYTDLAYQPMLELLGYLRANGFKTYIISGSGTEFLRTFSDPVFGIPPEQVVGTTVKTDYEIGENGKPELLLKAWPEFIDNKARKAESINEFIGRRPIAAFGNSDGDRQMLEWTAAGDGARMMLLVHHTDSEREYPYGQNAKVGGLSKALLDEVQNPKSSELPQHRWIVVDMRKDWKRIYKSDNVTRNGSAACEAR